MHNISNFRSILMLPLRIFLTLKSFTGIRSFFSQHLFLVFDIFFHFPTLVSKLFLQFSSFEFLWIVDVFSTLPICFWFQSLDQKTHYFFQLTKNFFWKNGFFILFNAFSILAGCFNFGGISFTCWKFFRVLNSVFISSYFCSNFTGVFVNFQITFCFFLTLIFTLWIFLHSSTISSNWTLLTLLNFFSSKHCSLCRFVRIFPRSCSAHFVFPVTVLSLLTLFFRVFQ